jgi:hypothetical protein
MVYAFQSIGSFARPNRSTSPTLVPHEAHFLLSSGSSMLQKGQRFVSNEGCFAFLVSAISPLLVQISLFNADIAGGPDVSEPFIEKGSLFF